MDGVAFGVLSGVFAGSDDVPGAGVCTAGDDGAGADAAGGCDTWVWDLAAFTVILQTAFTFLLLLETAVIFAVPAFFAVTTPLLLTAATVFLLDFHVTFLLALAGVTFFTFKVNFDPAVNVFFVAFNLSFFVLGAAFALGTEKTVQASAIDKTAATIFLEFFRIFLT